MNPKTLLDKSWLILLVLIAILIGLILILPRSSPTGSSTQQTFSANVEVVEPIVNNSSKENSLAISTVNKEQNSNGSVIIISGITINDKDSVKVTIK